MITHANACGAATTWVVSANTWHVTCIGFLVELFPRDRAAPPSADRLRRSTRH